MGGFAFLRSDLLFCSFFRISKMLGPALPRVIALETSLKDESVVLKSWVTTFLGTST